MKTTIDDVTLTSLGHREYAERGCRPHVWRVWEHRRSIVNCEFDFPNWDLDYYFTAGLEVTVRGTVECVVKREANTAHLYPPHRKFSERTPAGLLLHDAYVLFRGGEDAGLSALVANRSGFAQFRDPQRVLGRRILHMVRMAQIHGEAGFWQMQALFFDLVDVLHLARAVGDGVYEITSDQRAPTVDPISVGATAYLQENLDKPVGLGDIAHHLGVSVSTLSHRYRAAMGEGPMKTLMKLRLRRAAMLVVEGHGLKTVARMTGFVDASHFGRAFKAAFGNTPAEYAAGVSAPEPAVSRARDVAPLR